MRNDKVNGAGDRRVAVVILAGGIGRRVGADRNKVLLQLAGHSLVAHNVITALQLPEVAPIVVVTRPEDRAELSQELAPLLGEDEVWLVDGGTERHDSEYAALQVLRGQITAGRVQLVALHDAARPLATSELFTATINAARRSGGAVPAVKVPGLVDMSGQPLTSQPVAVQTPQVFAAPPLLAAYDQAAVDGFRGTDTAACIQRYTDLAIVAVPGAVDNIKVTYPADVTTAERLLQARQT